MDFLSKYVAQIRSYLVGLTVSQKILIGLLVAIMLGTTFVVVSFSGKPDMVELLPQALTSDEISTITSYLKSNKQQYEVSGQKVLVPVEQAYVIRGELAAAQALPKDTTAAFTALTNQNDWIMPEASSERRWNLAKQEVLAKVIRNFPYISDATVMIAKGERAGLGRNSVPTSASVWVKTRSADGLSQAQLLAMVDLVKGSVAGLKREDVTVTDGTRSYRAPSEDTPMPADVLSWKKTLEDYYTNKLVGLFANMGDVRIAVNVTPDMAAKTVHQEKYDPTVVKATRRETSKEDSSSEGGAPSGQPGVQPNVGAVATNNSAGKSTRSMSDTTTENENKFSSVVTNSVLPAGSEIKDMTASISIPRSTFVSIFRRMNKDEKAEPDDNALTTVIKEHGERMQRQAMNALGLKAADSVRVDWFDDSYMPRAEPAGAGGESILAKTGTIGMLAANYAKHAILGGVAVFAIMMMLMMVRRASAGATVADADPSIFFGEGGKKKSKGTSPLDVEDELIGEAGEGEAVLTGIELDDETLASRKMVDEVSTMIKENPENAAALVKRWMQKGR